LTYFRVGRNGRDRSGIDGLEAAASTASSIRKTTERAAARFAILTFLGSSADRGIYE
jgi:hypothetical protein